MLFALGTRNGMSSRDLCHDGRRCMNAWPCQSKQRRRLTWEREPEKKREGGPRKPPRVNKVARKGRERESTDGSDAPSPATQQERSPPTRTPRTSGRENVL